MHIEQHSIARVGWLRAAVLGANDGIVSTASLLLGVVSASNSQQNILLAGIAGLVAGAMSMATGEYVSVSSQSDSEKAALAEEQAELHADFPGETDELTAIYLRRGLEPALAREVAEKLMAHDPLAAHARDELGITEISSARPLQAALFSALSFAVGAVLPLVVALITVPEYTLPAVTLSTLLSLAILGAVAARAGSAAVLPGMLRVTFWSALAMGISAGVGTLVGYAVG
ncbi:VIT family protein [Pantoea sp. B65]|uniref:VIT1/CCC1 transporter family protein n=1 Tax=Pantoea sp. B65 TaxID=2813359 RepID=UPI0039B4ED41